MISTSVHGYRSLRNVLKVIQAGEDKREENFAMATVTIEVPDGSLRRDKREA